MNCSKHVEFYSKYKFERLVQLVGFIIRKTWTWVHEILVYTELQQRIVPEKKEKRQSRKQQVDLL